MELVRLEGRRLQALRSVRVTAGRGGGRGGGVLPVLVMLVRLLMSFLHFLPSLLVYHDSGTHHARSRRIHGAHARSRWWVWGRVGT